LVHHGGQGWLYLQDLRGFKDNNKLAQRIFITEYNRCLLP